MDKSILLQKQVKDNSEDFQKEFLDMKNWEEQMKRKDQELRKETSGQSTLPPIRSKSKNKTKSVPTKQNESNSKSKRIKSYDYSAWDKFDVDRACKDVEKEEQSDDSEDEAISKEDLQKAHEVATKHKNEGNFFVQQQKWIEAIGCYNKAIKVFPYDAVFYANRALCQLKLDNLYAAESDCSVAIQLDETYVKAYHRRATARMNLKQYKEAKQDLEKILKLEPSNKEAKLLLTQLEDKIKIADSVNVLKEDTEKVSEKSTIEKKIGEKMWCNAPRAKTADTKDIKTMKCSTEDEKKIKKKEDFKHSKGDRKLDLENTITKKEDRDPRIPDWLPEKDDVAVIEPIERPPHLRSKKLLTKIPVEEVDFAAIQYNRRNKEITCNKSGLAEQKKPSGDDDFKENNGFVKYSESPASPDAESSRISSISNLPPIPKTAVQFATHWKTNKSLEFRYTYLKQLPENSLSKIFQDSMESDIFSGILEVLKMEFMKREEPIFRYLRDLSEVKRFRALIMFISNCEKKSLRVLFEHCRTIENVSPEEVTALQIKYEL